MQEIWKDIKEYEGLYQVSNLGRVRSLPRTARNNNGYRKVVERFLKLNLVYGYFTARLNKNNKGRLFKVHRLVAEAFIPNPENKPCIDHINGCRTDNRVENLRWVTYKENSNNIITKLRFRRLSNVLCTETGIIYTSATDAEKETGIHRSSISAVCQGKVKTAGGYHWEYINN